MTIDIMFMAKNQLVLRVNMCTFNFENKILNDLIFDYYSETFTDKEFIEKVWCACVHHGYVSEDYDIIEKFLDMMKII